MAIPRTYVVKTNKKGDTLRSAWLLATTRSRPRRRRSASQSLEGRVQLGETLDINFKLSPAAAGPSKEDVAKAAAIKKVFDEGVARAGPATTTARSPSSPRRSPSFLPASTVITTRATRTPRRRSGTSPKRRTRRRSRSSPTTSRRTTVSRRSTTLQKKFDAAQAASQKAAELAMAAGGTGGGGGMEAVFNVGVTAWNAGKAEEAKKAFEEVLKIDPKHANSHYQLAMCFVNLGKMPEAMRVVRGVSAERAGRSVCRPGQGDADAVEEVGAAGATRGVAGCDPEVGARAWLRDSCSCPRLNAAGDLFCLASSAERCQKPISPFASRKFASGSRAPPRAPAAARRLSAWWPCRRRTRSTTCARPRRRASSISARTAFRRRSRRSRRPRTCPSAGTSSGTFSRTRPGRRPCRFPASTPSTGSRSWTPSTARPPTREPARKSSCRWIWPASRPSTALRSTSSGPSSSGPSSAAPSAWPD